MKQTSQTSQEKPKRNTKIASAPQNQLYRWEFTLHQQKPEIKPEELWKTLKGIAKEFYFQLEEGEETGALHFQGCFSLKEKEYMNTVKNLLGYNSIHLEPVKNWKALVEYSQKKSTRVDGPWSIQSTWIKTITSLRDWQQKLLTKLKEEPDDRTILWYSDPKGCSGKTSMAKYLAVHHNATVLNNAKTADLAYAINSQPNIIIINITRSNEQHTNYGAIESIKDGLIFSSKYESHTKLFNSPHVVIFANFEPNYNALTIDRWEIIHLSTKESDPYEL